MRRARGVLLPLWLLLASCRGADADTVSVRLVGSAGLPLSAAAISYQPASVVRSARLGSDGRLAVERRSSQRQVTVSVPGFCPVTIAAGAQPHALEAQPVIDLGGERAPLGFDAPFTIRVKHGCPERGRGSIAWRQLQRVPLRELKITDAGFELRGRTPSLERLHPESLPPGIVPFSPRNQGEIVLEATWSAEHAEPVRRTLRLVATSRASGLSSVPVSQQLVLAGPDWRVQKGPQNGDAEVQESGDVSLFRPDAPGRWTLSRPDGTALTLQAFWHDKTPYDCGRKECHAAIATAAVSSPMSHALELPLTAAAIPRDARCMLECHVLGERGLHDGGFLDVQSELGFTWLDGHHWNDLPRTLRRLGGVRCTACHGPGAIPPPEARDVILRSDVCATCHDAPPRYVHVQEWRASRMARADETPSTRAGECARCHTTRGFLESLGARKAHAGAEALPPAGIACAACHAPHAAQHGPRLVRMVNAAGALEPSSALCVSCHQPLPDAPQPSAASAALWLGRARVPALEPGRWDELSAAGPHRAVSGGCVGCHGRKSAADGGGVDHSFRSDRRACRSCHRERGLEAKAAASTRELRERAEALARRLPAECPLAPSSERAPSHASAAVSCEVPRLGRARYEIALVLEDGAAGVHGAALARSLLDDAEKQLAGR
jgi:hypothetical protein